MHSCSASASIIASGVCREPARSTCSTTQQAHVRVPTTREHGGREVDHRLAFCFFLLCSPFSSAVRFLFDLPLLAAPNFACTFPIAFCRIRFSPNRTITECLLFKESWETSRSDSRDSSSFGMA